MPRNSSGVYSLPVAAFVAGTVIRSADMNSDLSDIATALTQSLATTGVANMTGQFKSAAGSVAAPGIAFSAALSTGFYLAGTDQIGWAAAGVNGALFNADRTISWAGISTFVQGLNLGAATPTTPAAGLHLFSDDGDPAWIDSGGEVGAVGMVLLDTDTIASAAALDIDFSAWAAKYDNIILKLFRVAPATASATMSLRISTNGGSSFMAGASDYTWMQVRGFADGTIDTSADSADSVIRVGISFVDNSNPKGNIYILDMLTDVSFQVVGTTCGNFFSNPVGQLTLGQFYGYATGTIPGVNAVRIIASAGNILAQGRWALYGVKSR